MLKNKRGFTLVELLAVIVILAIILAIAIPAVGNITTKAKSDSFEATTRMLMKGVEFQQLQNPTYDAGLLNDLGVAAFGASTTDISAVTITNLNPLTITVTGSTSGGKFKNCTVTGATRSNLDQTGVDSGSISGC